MDITSVFKLLQDDIHSVVFATIKDMIRRKVPNEIFIIFSYFLQHVLFYRISFFFIKRHIKTTFATLFLFFYTITLSSCIFNPFNHNHQ